MNEQEVKHYEVRPSLSWENASLLGGGYDVMEWAYAQGWKAISAWGARGWDLGSWPYVIVFFRTTSHPEGNVYELSTYVEGDVTMYRCPSREIRAQICDGIAFFYWKQQQEEWVRDYATADDAAAQLRGPYREDRVA